MRSKRRPRSASVGWVLVLAALSHAALPACSDDGDDDGLPGTAPTSGSTTLPAPVVELPAADAAEAAVTYADVAHAAYADAVTGAESLRTSVASLVTTPSEATLAAARQSWVAARHSYGVTEAFRGYGGPIDALERRINGWPVDPASLDGVVADVDGLPLITPETLGARIASSPAEVTLSGFHAIELLLWGSDAAADGPGNRPASDFDAVPDADRRRMILAALADLLAADLATVRDQWSAGSGAYRAQFLADPRGAVQSALHGLAVLSVREIAGRRLAEALEAREPETEYARFSDNTLNDLTANARGVRAAYLGEYEGVAGTSLSAMVARFDPERDADLRKQLDNNLAALEALPGQFDQVVLAPDGDPDRAEFVTLADDFRAQGEAIVAVATVLGLTVDIGD